MRATGTFDVKVRPLANDHAEASGLGRMSIDKQFHGDLEATSQGQMLSFMSTVKGSAGYVAMERVTGKLSGHSGQAPTELAGLTGKLGKLSSPTENTHTSSSIRSLTTRSHRYFEPVLKALITMSLGWLPTGITVTSARAALIFEVSRVFTVRTTATSPDFVSATSK